MNQKDFLKAQNQIIDIKEALDEAEHDDTPFPVATEDGLKVVGDANKTEKKSKTYDVRFRFPLSMTKGMEDQVIEKIGNYGVIKMTFEDVDIVPRRDLKLLAAIMDVLPFFKELQEDGSTEKRSIEDLIAIFRKVPQETIDSMYMIVISFLDVDESIAGYMYVSDVLNTMASLIKDFPEVFNEADSFFA